MTVIDFYDRLAPWYHLLYPDWEASMQRQATALDTIIKTTWGIEVLTVLDRACGIGTQALGLAAHDYKVTASDVSSSAVARAQQEAVARGVSIVFSVADMREAYTQHQRQFDLVIACDNAVPHLLTEADLLQAFQQFYACTRPGGGCLISIRDYDSEERAGTQVKPYGLRVERETRYLVFQVWEFHGLHYDVGLYLVEDRGTGEGITQILRTTYYAVSISMLITLMEQAGFTQVQRIDHQFYQPVIVGTRPKK